MSFESFKKIFSDEFKNFRDDKKAARLREFYRLYR